MAKRAEKLHVGQIGQNEALKEKKMTTGVCRRDGRQLLAFNSSNLDFALFGSD